MIYSVQRWALLPLLLGGLALGYAGYPAGAIAVLCLPVALTALAIWELSRPCWRGHQWSGPVLIGGASGDEVVNLCYRCKAGRPHGDA